ncbi:Y4yA family PLP-dependent enzyme [Streptomyces sp. SP17KL33]|uniref:Y4yA family PLP-dependent enzyme n=1 Tax=Streptomyces sp. SP17KL33 TaxID=3002534 RepID=UPI002E78EB26|nr:Y4yA family PLP-dependent enzyme [Streptomyces sp. SP17KL33]MEE1836122.1 Y4yA family PLP-dependent enzyme [Streptomyces sp. SP17KL33]
MTTSAPPSLAARTTDEVRSLLDDPLLHELHHGLGGPYHLLFPGRFDANAAAFREALAEAGVEGQVYFAKKANKAAVFVERAAVLGLGVDVASHGELREALAHGVRGADVVVTGPAKSEQLLRVAVLQGSLVAVDAIDELDRVLALAAGLGRTARVLLRRLPPGQPHSRFGLDEDECETALRRCSAGPVDVEGFSFHLSGYDVRQRADLAGQLVRLCLHAREMGLRADRISIGGGFAVDYVGADDWRRFTKEHRPEHYHADKTFSGFYPYHSPVAGADALRAVLGATPAGEREPLARLLRAAGVRLLAEPGRALLDQAGCTVFAVQGVKERDGYAVLTVDGTSLSLSEQWFESEYLPEPVLVPHTEESDAGPFPACVGAATCLESDMISWRKIPFPLRPVVGDLLLYLNTAGYQMDSNESPFHELALPPKVVIEHPSDSVRPRWRLDRHP